MPALSVIVPVFGAEQTLARCVRSVLSQSFSDLELILVDDGSPDRSGVLCDEYSAEDSRVRVFHQANSGVSAARNLGLRHATGDYVAFADADDWWEPDSFSALFSALTAAGADSAGCAHWNVSPDGHRWAEPGVLPAGVYGPAELRAGVVDALLGRRLGKPGEVVNGFIWRFLFSRAILAEHDLTFAGAYLEDDLFLMEYFCLARRLVMIDSPLYCYLQNPASVTRRYLPGYVAEFGRYMAAKRELARRFSLGAQLPDWEHNSNWSGLLIAIGNEYAPGNSASLGEKMRRVKAIAAQPELAAAIASLNPTGLGRNKQLVAYCVRRRWFLPLTALYAVKNRGKR